MPWYRQPPQLPPKKKTRQYVRKWPMSTVYKLWTSNES